MHRANVLFVGLALLLVAAPAYARNEAAQNRSWANRLTRLPSSVSERAAGSWKRVTSTGSNLRSRFQVKSPLLKASAGKAFQLVKGGGSKGGKGQSMKARNSMDAEIAGNVGLTVCVIGALVGTAATIGGASGAIPEGIAHIGSYAGLAMGLGGLGGGFLAANILDRR